MSMGKYIVIGTYKHNTGYNTGHRLDDSLVVGVFEAADALGAVVKFDALDYTGSPLVATQTDLLEGDVYWLHNVEPVPPPLPVLPNPEWVFGDKTTSILGNQDA